MIGTVRAYTALLVAMCAVMGAAYTAAAAGGSAGGGGSSSGATGSSVGGGLSASPGGAGTAGRTAGAGSGLSTGGAVAGSQPMPGKRKAVEDGLRKTGSAPSPTEDKQELRSLNQISRQIAPGVAVPAPEVNR